MIDSSEEGKVELLNQCIEIQRFLFNADSIAELLQLTEKLFEELLPLEYSGLYLFNERSQKLELKIVTCAQKIVTYVKLSYVFSVPAA